MAGYGMACLVMRPQQDTATIATILAFTFCLTICIFTQTTLTHPPARRWGTEALHLRSSYRLLQAARRGLHPTFSERGGFP